MNSVAKAEKIGGTLLKSKLVAETSKPSDET